MGRIHRRNPRHGRRRAERRKGRFCFNLRLWSPSEEPTTAAIDTYARKAFEEVRMDIVVGAIKAIRALDPVPSEITFTEHPSIGLVAVWAERGGESFPLGTLSLEAFPAFKRRLESER